MQKPRKSFPFLGELKLTLSPIFAGGMRKTKGLPPQSSGVSWESWEGVCGGPGRLGGSEFWRKFGPETASTRRESRGWSPRAQAGDRQGTICGGSGITQHPRNSPQAPQKFQARLQLAQQCPGCTLQLLPLTSPMFPPRLLGQQQP